MLQRDVYDPVPAKGPLTLGAVYKRADLHARYGGSRIAGIVSARDEPIVLLFHTEEPTKQFYRDGFTDDGLYWYSGQGTSGDMTWTAGNRSIRDHTQLRRNLLLFERVRRKGGLWRFSYIMHFSRFREEERVDARGQQRRAIVFGLLPIACARHGLSALTDREE